MRPSSSELPTISLNQLLARRQLLKRAGSGLGTLGLLSLLQQEGVLEQTTAAPSIQATNPLAPKPTHFPAKAKAVIWLFINGGPSQVDTWDYKPELEKRDGVALEGFDNKTGFFQNSVGPLMKSPFKFKQYGESGKWVSEIFPNMAQHVDKMAFIHSGHTESNNHSPALFMMNSGLPKMGYPCVGSWVTYGLGSESNSLPAFVVMSDPLGRGLPKGQSLNWGAGFLPSVYQGTYLRPTGEPIDNLQPPAVLTEKGRQRSQLDLLKSLNRQHLQQNDSDQELAARIESFELAYRMQSAAPEALDIGQEPKHLQEQYGIGNKKCEHFAKQCLIARRMVERGTRFVQIYSGGMENQRSWDGHSDIKGNHSGFAEETDQPIAALLADLEARGLLNETLVIWGGEFGRLPIAQKGATPGRDHNPHAFTTWLAGGGVKAGTSYGATDEIGFKAAENKVHVNDLHATILRLLGMDHEKLTYLYSGRRFRLTDVGGHVINDIIA
ncbi:hypothetical protein Mal35_37790 [Gimesia maris]|jgi:hypothetical protein|uniref:DUF1501 domain-containing protein n=1 Tax=Gimesia maris TaxID=122 RepID=UPI00118BC3BC|nr:DUF1501 domain-containing protein [Gimesia maris]QDT80308.1 hypothetical protein Mal35_37790 [Gimesia maris]|tara:strand:- start:74397 stop:75884 length:1488 start_codon:yes stop_codon:yes gene_type:complete